MFRKTTIAIEPVYGNQRDDRMGLVVNIQRGELVFKWMPTYSELQECIEKLKEVEEMNKNHAVMPSDGKECDDLLKKLKGGNRY